ncbi:MAG: type II toxin-antitoxin system VapB family antitoxin [Verrucomicrobiota bacterium]|nr:type II toxin-antitoxin system VapB family antitoxin [Verrucomicrobiota bacterium]
MRMTVELDEKTLAELLKVTGMKKNSPAVAFAVREFVNRKKAREFGMMLREGRFDYPTANEEAEARQDI